jgi:drug/metabolite transporter (DMT)-like permease
MGLSGIALVSSGIMILMLGKSRADSRSLISALAAGAFIASYMVTDGLGVRAAGSALGYAAWQAVLAGSVIYASYFLVRRQKPAMPRGREGAILAVAGILATLAYCVALWAMSESPMGGVSAIRETSILFAALIGAVALKERLTMQKLLGAFTIAGGVICLALW